MADNFYSRYSANTPSTVVTQLNGLNGAVTLAAGSNITITPAGNTLTIASTASGGANTTLSNLTSPTAINQNLLPNADDTIILGTAITKRFKEGYFSDIIGVGRYPFGGATPGAALLDGAAPGLYVYNGGSDAYNIVADAGSGVAIQNPGAGVSLFNVQNHQFVFKDSTSGSTYLQGDMSNLVASTGIELSTTTGALLLSRMDTTERDALTAANGMEIYNTTTDKFQAYEDGAWVDMISAGGGGANTTLSNLGTTAINASLLFDTDQVYDIGLAGTAARYIYAGYLKVPGAGDTLRMDIGAGFLYDDTETRSIQIQDRLLVDHTGSSTSLDWDNRFLKNVFGGNALSWSTDFTVLTTDSGTESGSINFTTGASVSRGTFNISASNLDFEADTTITISSVAGDINISTSDPGNVTLNGGQDATLTSQNGVTIVESLNGTIKLKNGSQGTAGDVWTSTGTDGEGSWTTVTYGISRSVSNISTNTTLAAVSKTDYAYFVTGTTTTTMPTAVGNTNRYTIKNTGANTVTVDTTGGQTIDGSATASLPTPNTSIDLISDGSNWKVV